MQNTRETSLLKEFYGKHRSIIDALAQVDEMFRAVKEIAGSEVTSLENAEGIGSLDKRFHKIPERGGICPS